MVAQPNTPQAELSTLYSEEAERATLGAILTAPNQMPKLEGYLKADHFFLLRHQMLWQAITTIYNRDHIIDLIPLKVELQAKSQLELIGGVAYLTQLINAAPNSYVANIYGQLVYRLWRRRGLIVLGDTIKQMAGDSDLSFEEVTAQVNQRVYDATGAVGFKPLPTMQELASRYLDKIERIMKHPDTVVGLSTGFKDLDKLLMGLQAPDLILVGGRPGMGKSSFLLSMILQVMDARSDIHVAYFSQETSDDQVTTRATSTLTGINLQTLNQGTVSEAEYRRVVDGLGKLSQYHLHIDDAAGSTPTQVRSRCRQIKDQYGRLDLIVVDYLQLMNADEKTDNQAANIGSISKSLKQMARDFNVPILAAAQLSRALENRADKHPILSDLRESGQLEQDADIVMFLYRDDYYNEASEHPNQVEITIAKHRNGPTGWISLYFEKTLTRFINAAPRTIKLGVDNG